MKEITNNNISVEEIFTTLEPLNNQYFYIDDLKEYAEKIKHLGKALVLRDFKNAELQSYVLYYDNNPEIFISMVWTHPKHQGKGLAKRNITELIQKTNKVFSGIQPILCRQIFVKLPVHCSRCRL